MAGKDRTGVFAAIVLGLLGVADADIVTDYALTHEVIDGIHARTRAARPGIDEIWSRLPPEIIGAHAATMEGLLGLVRERWGAMTGYTAALGVQPGTVEKLRDALLTEP